MKESAILVIDVHTHIFPGKMIRERDKFFEGEPEFSLLYESPKAKLASAETLIESMDENGVDRSVVFGFPWRTPDFLVRHNDYVLEAAAKYPSRLIPLACLDLFSDKCVAEAQRRSHEGVAGFGELAVYKPAENIDAVLDNFRETARLCREKGLVLLVHSNEPVGHVYPGKAPFGLDFYYSLVKAAEGVTLIFAHWGGGILFFELLKKEAPQLFTNVFYDTAASPFLYRAEIYRAATYIAGSTKVLFGSDYPLISPKRYFTEIRQSGLDEADVDAILGENAARIFRT
jgi:predicted TIM-barrel fold metal-dependent hydrolase